MALLLIHLELKGMQDESRPDTCTVPSSFRTHSHSSCTLHVCHMQCCTPACEPDPEGSESIIGIQPSNMT